MNNVVKSYFSGSWTYASMALPSPFPATPASLSGDIPNIYVVN